MENQNTTSTISAHESTTNTNTQKSETSPQTRHANNNNNNSPTNAKKNKNNNHKKNREKQQQQGSPEALLSPKTSSPSQQTTNMPTTNADSADLNNEQLPLRTQIMKQLEYYFSDENLNRDKFLTKEMEKDESKQGYISLDLLATFPRMQRLSLNIDEIRAAVRESTIIKLSKSGQKVKRLQGYEPPLTDEQQVEQRTIYVSYLPKNSDRNSVKGIFGICGNIRRVDLPVDKKSGEIKGIAFVEFEDKEQAKKALKYFSEKSNDFYKLGMRCRAFSLKPPFANNTNNNNANNISMDSSPPSQPHNINNNINNQQQQLYNNNNGGYDNSGYDNNNNNGATMTVNGVPYYPLQQYGHHHVLSPVMMMSPYGTPIVVDGSLSPPIAPISSHPQTYHHSGYVAAASSSPQHHNNINSPNNNNNNNNNSPSKFTSIYEQAPTFNYSNSKDKRKKRSGSKPEPLQQQQQGTTSAAHNNNTDHHHHHHNTNNNSSSSNNNNNNVPSERPKLQLRPRSDSIGSQGGRLSGLGGLGTPGSIVPLRQPFPPDGTRGFSAGRGKPLAI